MRPTTAPRLSTRPTTPAHRDTIVPSARPPAAKPNGHHIIYMYIYTRTRVVVSHGGGFGRSSSLRVEEQGLLGKRDDLLCC